MMDGAPSLRRSLPVVDADDRFAARLARAGLPPMRRASVTTLQVNLGKRCNQACLHCHVDAGPLRTESMTDAVLDGVLALVAKSPALECVDITGGAPELHPRFRELVTSCRAHGKRVIDRNNLTILGEPGMEDLAAFLAESGAEVVASLPCYLPTNVDAQRGRGVYERSIAGLRQLNAHGFGMPGSPRVLRLVYNPGGPSLPPPQAALEDDYRRRLLDDHGVHFHALLTLTNLPIARFRHALERDGKLEPYLTLLDERFNAETVPEVMCRTLLSVAWDGQLYDCDFHQQAELPLGAGLRELRELDSLDALEGAPIPTATHCLGCTAGAGSSCSGALR